MRMLTTLGRSDQKGGAVGRGQAFPSGEDRAN